MTKNTRKFEGRIYHKVSQNVSKRVANDHAKNLRKKGMNARIIPIKSGYNVYTARNMRKQKQPKSKRILSRDILTEEDFKNAEIDFHRKSNINDDYPFDVEGFNEPDAILLDKTYIVKVSKTQYQQIAGTLNDIPRNILDKSKTFRTDKWGYMYGFIMTDGRRYMAIDTQGYDYPRYKGVIKIKGEILPFE